MILKRERYTKTVSLVLFTTILILFVYHLEWLELGYAIAGESSEIHAEWEGGFDIGEDQTY